MEKKDINDEFDKEDFAKAVKAITVPTVILFKEYKAEGLSTMDAAVLAGATFAEMMKGFTPPKRDDDEDELEL